MQKKTRTTRSRIEEEAKRKKAQPAAVVAVPSPTSTSASVPAPKTHVAQDPSSSKSVHPHLHEHAQQVPAVAIPATATITIVPPQVRRSRSTSSSCTTSSEVTVQPSLRFNVDPVAFRPPDVAYAPHEAAVLYQRNEEEEQYDSSLVSPGTGIAAPPGMQFTRETWWDALIAFYADLNADNPALGLASVRHGGDGTLASLTLTSDMRDATMALIATDLRFLFKVSLHWFAFMHVPRFFGALFDPYRRRFMQPSLVLSALALTTFFQSSELERGAKGREMALRLLEEAHALFDASLASGWVDLGLVQAAWVRAI